MRTWPNIARCCAAGGRWNKPAEQAAIVPIKQQGQEQPAGFFVAGTNPYRRYRTPYSGFVDLLAGQISSALGNARAYEGGTAARRSARRTRSRQDDLLFECESRAPDAADADVEPRGGVASEPDAAESGGPGTARTGSSQRASPPEAGQHPARFFAHRGRPDSSQLRTVGTRPIHRGVRLHLSIRDGEGRPDLHHRLRAASGAGLCGSRHVGKDRPESSFQCPEVHLRGQRQCCGQRGRNVMHS